MALTVGARCIRSPMRLTIRFGVKAEYYRSKREW
jgi:hypothetical protein